MLLFYKPTAGPSGGQSPFVTGSERSLWQQQHPGRTAQREGHSNTPSTSTAHMSTHTAEELYFLIPILPASKATRIPPKTEKIGLGPLRLFLYLTEIKIKETTLLC